MNDSNSRPKEKIENYYEQETIGTIEKAELAEDVVAEGFTEVKGKFFIKVMTPSVDTSEPSKSVENGIESSNYVELLIPPYMLLAFANVQFDTIDHTPNDGEYDHKAASGNGVFLTAGSKEIRIPKGTVFLAEFLGGNLEIGAACIVGIYSMVTGS